MSFVDAARKTPTAGCWGALIEDSTCCLFERKPFLWNCLPTGPNFDVDPMQEA
jgi:hypothetical protein